MHPIKLLLTGLLFTTLIACSKTPPKPDIIIVTWDTTRADHIGPEDPKNVTPWAMKLADEGLRFTEARTTVPYTLPAHVSLLTGQLPHKHGIRLNSDGPLPPETISVAEIFQSQGYKTAAFVSSSVVSAESGMGQGFDHYDDNIAPPTELTSLPARKATDTLNLALSWLNSQQKEQPIFLFVHLFEPHRPWIPPIEMIKKFKGDRYRALINMADTQTGRLIQALEERGSLERSLFILTSDHGEGLGEHGEQTHGYFAYDATVRVPLIIRPGKELGTFERGKTSESPVSLIDLPSTMTELIGLPPLGKSGQSLMPELHGQKLPQRRIIFESLGPVKMAGAAPILGILEDGETLLEVPIRERYAVAQDPSQLDNLYTTTEKARFDSLIPDSAWSQEHTNAGKISAERLAQLKALGYIEGDGIAAVENAPDPKERIGVMELLDPFEYGHFTPQSILVRNAELLEAYGPQQNVIHQMAHNLDILGFHQEALEIIQVGLQAHPDSELLQTTEAELSKGREQKEALVTAIQGHLKSTPEDVVAYFDLGLTLHYLQRYDAAQSAYEKTLALQPSNLRARLMLARVLGATNQEKAAITLLTGEGVPKSPALECEVGRFLFSFNGEVEKAGKHIQTCAEAGVPLDATLAFILARSLRQ